MKQEFVVREVTSVEERVHVSPLGPSQFLKTMAILLEIRKVGMKA
jgi:hypothetical protein